MPDAVGAEATPDLDHLQAGLVLLMDRYVEAPCPGIAAAVTGQLEAILHHPLVELFPRLQRSCARRLNAWRARAVASRSPGVRAGVMH
jgi:hypothetical protein